MKDLNSQFTTGTAAWESFFHGWWKKCIPLSKRSVPDSGRESGGKAAAFWNSRTRKKPRPCRRAGRTGLVRASSGCADVACRCLGIKQGSGRIAAPRSEGSALHRRTSGGCCLLPPTLAAVSVPGEGEDHSVSCGFYPGDPWLGPACRGIGSSSRSSV